MARAIAPPKPELTPIDETFVQWLDSHWSHTFRGRAKACVRYSTSQKDAVIAFRMAVTRDWQDTTFALYGQRHLFTDVNFANVVANYWSQWRRGNQRKQVQVFMVELISRWSDRPYFYVLATDDPTYYRRSYRYGYAGHNVLYEFSYQPEDKLIVVDQLMLLRNQLQAQGARVEMDVKIGNLKLDSSCNRPYYMQEYGS